MKTYLSFSYHFHIFPYSGIGVWETTIDSMLDERIIVALLVNEMQI